MKLYITKEDYEKVKNSFLNLRTFSVINVQEIIESFNYNKDSMNEYAQFIVNDEIENSIKDSISKKKFFNIMYVNTDLTLDTINSLKDFASETEHIDKIIFVDNFGENKDLYPLFDEVIFFPKAKRVRIIQCQSIKNPLYYWVNNKPFPEEIEI